MDPKTAVNSSESDRQRAAARDGYTATELTAEPVSAEHSDRAGQSTPAANRATPASSRATPVAGNPTDTQRRVSLDPMRATDRYRLVHPANAI